MAEPRTHYGYSVGIGFPPDWVEHSMYLHEGDERPLQAGMTFHSPIGYFIPAKDVAAYYSETWVVTENGGVPLTTMPRELVVIDR